jgi:hypothetical protein
MAICAIVRLESSGVNPGEIPMMETLVHLELGEFFSFDILKPQ